MPILTKCEQCKRKGGYAETANDKVCYRCKLKQKVKKEKHE